MLKFFRIIRRKLISEGNLNRYLIYAIGEVLLVVIGILIALEVNNWNEANRTSKLEGKYLERIRFDLIEDTVYFRRRLKESQHVINNHTELIRRMYDHQKNETEYRDLLSLVHWNSEHLTVQNSTYIELLSTGHINILSNPDLKTEIVSLYKKYDEVSTHIKEINEFSIQQYSKIVNMQMKYRQGAFDIWPEEDMFDKTEWQYINQPFTEDFNRLETTAAYYLIKHHVFINYFTELLQRDKELIMQIDNDF